ncbi:MAG: nucleotidyltransferase family protein [Marinovum sp.]|nr:nucleotidyltransferase family protein [Marinovum sp.]
MFEMAAILLAAGLSRRMGPTNKLLLEISGKPMVRHVAETYLSAIDGPLTVVTGFEADRVGAALWGLDLHLVHNDVFIRGQPSSVSAGLVAAPEAELLLIGLADQPLLTASNLRSLMACHKNADPRRITIPMRGDRRGNPIVIPRLLRDRLTENPERPGCMRFTRDFPEHVQRAPMEADGFYHDIDTLDDSRALPASDAEVVT